MSAPAAKRQKNTHDADEEELPPLVPITILSGFLGAGKTTMLKHLLENKKGLKVGLIVNDVAELNIDAALVSSQGGQGHEDTVQLSNGCACCSSSEELVKSIHELMELSEINQVFWDHIVIELSGVAEPKEVRKNFATALVECRDMLAGTELHTVVTVVDASTFMHEFQKKNKVEDRCDLGENDWTDGNRQVVDLMCEQVECADVIVINKKDLVDGPQLQLTKEVLSSLNKEAAVHTTSRGKMGLAAVIGAATTEQRSRNQDIAMAIRREIEHAAVKAGKRHDGDNKHADDHHHHDGHHHDHGHSHDGHEGHAHERPEAREAKAFGITSFVYERRRPFHPGRLLTVAQDMPVNHFTLDEALTSHTTKEKSADTSSKSPLLSLIRSKGFIWLASASTYMFYWAQAGKSFELRPHALWWSNVPKEDWPESQPEVISILKDFGGTSTDKRQALVFIGVGMDEKAICALLDEALCTPAEMKAYEELSIVAPCPPPTPPREYDSGDDYE